MAIAARRTTVGELLARARAGCERLTPEEAWNAAQRGADIVDTRSDDERLGQGVVIPGSYHHPLSVLAWRLDPDYPTSNPRLPLDACIVLVCREGYSSSLAAGWLRELGFERATDVIGGVDRWRAAGLPLEPYLATGRRSR